MSKYLSETMFFTVPIKIIDFNVKCRLSFIHVILRGGCSADRVIPSQASWWNTAT